MQDYDRITEGNCSWIGPDAGEGMLYHISLSDDVDELECQYYWWLQTRTNPYAHTNNIAVCLIFEEAILKRLKEIKDYKQRLWDSLKDFG